MKIASKKISAEKMIKDADLLVFSYPVYTFIAPYQLHRFIEIIKEKGIEHIFVEPDNDDPEQIHVHHHHRRR